MYLKTAQSQCFWIALMCCTLVFTRVEGQTCKAIDRCTCDCNGDVYSLKSLSTLQAFEKDEYEYFFSPCGSLKSVDTQCEGSSVCQRTIKTKDYHKVAKEGGATFEGKPPNLLFLYPTIRSGDKKYRKAVVKLLCAEKETQAKLLFVNQSNADEGKTEDDPIVYTFTLMGQAACAEDNNMLSAGSILLIIFFVGVFIYIVGGIIINACLRGAVGLEIIPNYSFWKDFPLLVKDGIMFTVSCSCCKSDGQQSYDNI